MYEYFWPRPLVAGRFLKRYKRFFADIEITTPSGPQVVTAHVANTGSLKTCLHPNEGALILPYPPSDKRKLAWSLKALWDPEHQDWIGIDTQVPSKILAGLAQHQPQALDTRSFHFQAEVKITPETRLDGCLDFVGHQKQYIELKNVTLAQFDTAWQKTCAYFPDAVSTRGQKHLETLMELKHQGHESRLIFMVQRAGCQAFRAADFVDPKYAKLLAKAHQLGVQIEAWSLSVSPQSVTFTGKKIPLLW